MVYINWIDIQTILSQIFHSNIFLVFLTMVIFDFILGTSMAIYNGVMNSKTGTQGLLKHTIVLLLVLLISIIGRLVGYPQLGSMFKVFYIFEYGVSILESLDVIGIPFPEAFSNHFLKMRKTNSDKWRKEEVYIKKELNENDSD